MPDIPILGTTVPNPGSAEARAQGCSCPVLDNNHGRGYRGNPNVFVRVVGCPLHCPQPEESHVDSGSAESSPDLHRSE